jgi:hypothetical protein
LSDARNFAAARAAAAEAAARNQAYIQAENQQYYRGQNIWTQGHRGAVISSQRVPLGADTFVGEVTSTTIGTGENGRTRLVDSSCRASWNTGGWRESVQMAGGLRAATYSLTLAGMELAAVAQPWFMLALTIDFLLPHTVESPFLSAIEYLETGRLPEGL